MLSNLLNLVSRPSSFYTTFVDGGGGRVLLRRTTSPFSSVGFLFVSCYFYDTQDCNRP